MSTLDFVTGYKTLHSDFRAKNGFSYGEENHVVSADGTPRVGRAGLHIYKTLTDAIEAHPHRPVLAEAIGFGEVEEGRRSYACTHAAITRVLPASEAYAILGAEAHPAEEPDQEDKPDLPDRPEEEEPHDSGRPVEPQKPSGKAAQENTSQDHTSREEDEDPDMDEFLARMLYLFLHTH